LGVGKNTLHRAVSLQQHGFLVDILQISASMQPRLAGFYDGRPPVQVVYQDYSVTDRDCLGGQSVSCSCAAEKLFCFMCLAPDKRSARDELMHDHSPEAASGP